MPLKIDFVLNFTVSAFWQPHLEPGSQHLRGNIEKKARMRGDSGERKGSGASVAQPEKDG